MDAMRSRRFRFGLRTLLLLVALSAVGAKFYKMRPGRIDLKMVHAGMTSEQLRFEFGEPEFVFDRSAPIFETWKCITVNNEAVHLRLRNGELMYWWFP